MADAQAELLLSQASFVGWVDKRKPNIDPQTIFPSKIN